MAMPELSQLEIIGDGRWERALFTTYALSLTWFETYVLPRLRQAGCQHVTVLVDVEGYRASMMERRARHVGQEYALIPVSNSQGVFHPKLTYLQGPERADLLMVGSGNLTYGGHGRNLEILEALDSRTEGRAFSDFAEFLQGLEKREGLLFGNPAPLREFARRAQYAGADAPEGATRLLHCLDEPIHQQLIALAGERLWDELFVLSPFHSASGEPIRTLAERLGVGRVLVGVPNGTDRTCSFPFHLVEKWNVPVSPVQPADENELRTVHAKWLELRGEASWALTGSVNATVQSMGSTKNIEVGVLRELKSPSSNRWRPAPVVPNYEADEIVVSGDPCRLTVFVELAPDGSTLAGHLMGAPPLEGVWSIQLETGQAEPVDGEVEVAPAGTFEWHHKGLSLFSASGGMQVNMVQGEREARGWLSVESILRLPSPTRHALGALKRMLEGNETFEDVQAVIDYLTAQMYLAIQHEYRSSSPARDVGGAALEPEDRPVALSELLTPDIPQVHLYHDLASTAFGQSQPWKVLDTLARLLIGRHYRPGKGKGGHAHPESDTEVENEEDERTLQEHAKEWATTRAAVGAFDDKMREVLRDAGMDGPRRRTVLLAWNAAMLDMYVLRLDAVPDAQAFLPTWFREATRLPAGDGDRELLDEAVFGVAAVMLESAGPEMEIHERLETYLGGAVDESAALACAQSWLSGATAVQLVADSNAALVALGGELQRKTRRQVLAEFVEARLANTEPPTLDPWFAPAEQALLRGRIKRVTDGGRPWFYRANPRTSRSCPACHHVLDDAALGDLRTRRFTKCKNRGCTLVAIEP